jgi:hypothetical protein
LPSNTNVTCTGTDTVGSRAGTGTRNVAITVESGATVTRNQGDPERVLSVYSNSQITNDGSLSSTGNTAAGLPARAGGNTLTNNGAVMGAVDQGGGTDSVEISGGTVSGNVHQGAGRDDFRMSGGEIASLNQGDNIDSFTMSGGRIVDAFDDGDRATMTGGRIGRVNMKLDDNVFEMSDGTIDGNLVTGFGDDTVVVEGGTIGGNISVSGGRATRSRSAVAPSEAAFWRASATTPSTGRPAGPSKAGSTSAPGTTARGCPT